MNQASPSTRRLPCAGRQGWRRSRSWRSKPSWLGRPCRAPYPGSSGEARHPGGNPGANLKSICHRCHPILVAFVWELTKETIDLPLGCLQGGATSKAVPVSTLSVSPNSIPAQLMVSRKWYSALSSSASSLHLSPSPSLSRRHPFSLSYLTHIHTLSLSLARSLSISLSLYHSFTHSHAHTHSHTHSLSHTHPPKLVSS